MTAYQILAAIVKELITVVLEQLKKNIEDLIVLFAFKTGVDIAGNIFSGLLSTEEAHNLYKVASPNYNLNHSYVAKNGILYNSVNDLHDYALEKDIQDYLYSNHGPKDCKVLRLNTDSSLAKKIINSDEMKTFISKNINELRNNKIISEDKIIFKNGDLYNSLHGAQCNNVKLNKNGDITMSIRDFYNFESGRTSLRGRIGEKLQNQEEFINYFLVIDIKIPSSIWKNYKI